MNAPIEGIFVTVSFLLLTGMVTCRPRRRFCENFPFAPRCLGVAAKRDVSHSFHTETDLDETYNKLQTLINKYGNDESSEYWNNRNDETDSNSYEVPYQLISHLMRTRREPDISQAEALEPDMWDDYAQRHRY